MNDQKLYQKIIYTTAPVEYDYDCVIETETWGEGIGTTFGVTGVIRKVWIRSQSESNVEGQILRYGSGLYLATDDIEIATSFAKIVFASSDRVERLTSKISDSLSDMRRAAYMVVRLRSRGEDYGSDVDEMEAAMTKIDIATGELADVIKAAREESGLAAI